MRISALITNYNAWPLASRCVDHLRRWSGDHLEKILVIDDCSSDAPPSFLTKQIDIRMNKQRMGYVGSVNVGFSLLRDSEVIILLDSDAPPLMDLVLPVASRFSEDPTLAALGFSVFDGRSMSAGEATIEPGVLELLLGQRVGSLYARIARRFKPHRSILFSCAMAVRTAAFFELSGFDEAFDFLDADLDFSLRLHEAGWQVVVERGLLVLHEGGGSPQARSKRVLRYHANRWRLLEKHGRLRLRPVLKLALAGRHTLEYLVLAIAGRRLVGDPHELREKLAGWRRLLATVWSGYANDR